MNGAALSRVHAPEFFAGGNASQDHWDRTGISGRDTRPRPVVFCKLMAMLAILRTALVAVFLTIYLLLIGPLGIVVTLLTGRIEPVYEASRWGLRLAHWLAGVRLEVVGRENLYSGAPCVYVCNHVSSVEPLSVFVILPRVVILGKKELWKIPIVGTLLTLAKFIPVERGTDRAAQAADLSAERLREGFSVVAFPEGTRSWTGELLPFRHGIFLMAIRAGAPIVPITVVGVREIMPRGTWLIRPGMVRLIVHPPVPTAGLREEDRGALGDRVREIIGSALPRAAA